MEEPRRDLRDAGKPDESEGLKPLEHPEPLVVPPDELHQQREEIIRAMQEEEANRVFYHFAEEIKLLSFGKVFGFMRQHMAVYRQAREMPGFIAGGIRGAWWRKRFYTYTAWESAAARERFVSGSQHSELVRLVVAELGAPGSAYVEWDNNESPDWEDANSRLSHPAHYYVSPSNWGQ